MTPQDRAAEAYEAHRDDIYKFLLIAGLSRDLAQEAVQEAFLKLFMAYSKGETIEHPRAWAHRVAYHFALKSMRPDWRFEALDPEWMPEGIAVNGNAELALLERERIMQLRNAFEELSPQQRQCIHLRAEGLRYHEIAATLGVGVSTVGKFLGRAMAKLRRGLA
jgi:RNA polymerase sigma-70 factor (ECF subfamily)